MDEVGLQNYRMVTRHEDILRRTYGGAKPQNGVALALCRLRFGEER
jgi:hypothetical protein